MIVVVLLLTLLGTLALASVTIKFYWGERGKPPASGDERRRQKDEELKLRRKQIERAKNNPIRARRESFWNNEKI